MFSDYICFIFILLTRQILGFLNRDKSDLNKYMKGQVSIGLR